MDKIYLIRIPEVRYLENQLRKQDDKWVELFNYYPLSDWVIHIWESNLDFNYYEKIYFYIDLLLAQEPRLLILLDDIDLWLKDICDKLNQYVFYNLKGLFNIDCEEIIIYKVTGDAYVCTTKPENPFQSSKKTYFRKNHIKDILPHRLGNAKIRSVYSF